MSDPEDGVLEMSEVLAGFSEMREGFESALEVVSDPLSLGLGVALNPVAAALRATVGLPQATETAVVTGLHIEILLMPAPPPINVVPTPGATLFLGYVPPNLVGIAIDVASWLMGGMSTVPVQGVFWNVLPAIAAGASADGIHVPLGPGLPETPLGSVSFLMGSDSVDIDDHHAVRWFEIGMGCNHLAPFVPQSVDLPNSTLLLAIPTGFPVLVGGNSVLDVGAVIDAAIAFIRKQILDAVLGFDGGWLASVAASTLEEVVKDALDGNMDGESIAGDVAKGIWRGTQRHLRQQMRPGAASSSSGATASTSVRRVRSTDEPAFAIT